MIPVKAYAAQTKTSPLAPYSFSRRAVGPNDILIDITYCGVCHSDLHMARDEWKGSMYPLVPGHEIVGRVKQVGANVKKFKAGDNAGVGVFVDSCRVCSHCKAGLQQYCDEGMVGTYSNYERDKISITSGGYSSAIVVDADYAYTLKFQSGMERVAPLLCAGITTWSPLKHLNVSKGHKVAVLGLGGLGHMAVKLAVSLGAEVTMLSSSKSKEGDAKKLGAHHFVLTSDESKMKSIKNHFDVILNTVSADHDMGSFIRLLRTDGTMIMVGLPPDDIRLNMMPLINGRKRLMGSMIGGLPETQEMLDYCATHNILSDIELIPMSKINEAFERILKSDVKYRFVIDMATI